MQGNGLGLLAGVAQALAQEGYRGLRDAGVRLDQAVEPRLRHSHDGDTRDSGRVRRTGAPIKTCDLAKNLAGIRMLERQCSPIRREDGEANGSFHNKINFAAGIAAGKDRLPLLVGSPMHVAGHCQAVGLSQRAE